MRIYQMITEEDQEKFKLLSIEYLQWAVDQLKINYDAVILDDVVEKVEEDMRNLDKLMPPKGHLLLCDMESEPVGMAGMKALSADTCEIKRMYVQPKFRGRGIASALFASLVDIAKKEKYAKMRLDSNRFMTSAHKLYRANGFKEIEPYEGSEIPPELSQYWIYFERSLDASQSNQNL